MKRKPFIMQGICLFMLLFGMHLCVYSIFLKAGSLYKFAAALAVAAMWFSFLAAAPDRRMEQRVKQRFKLKHIKYPVADFLLVLTLVVWVILTIPAMGHLQKDFETLQDAVAYRQNLYYYHTKANFNPYAPHRFGATGTWILLDLELLAGLFMSRTFVHRRGLFWGTLPPVMLVVGGLLLGKSPTIPAMILLIMGILGIQMCMDEHHKGGSKYFRQLSVTAVRHWLFYPVMLVCLLAILGLGAQASVNTEDQALRGEKKLLKVQHAMEREIADLGVKITQKMQDILGLERPGVLTNTSPSYTGKTVLTLTVDKEPKEDVYLRGFIGTKYENGKWSSPSKDKLDSLFSSEKCYQLFTQDFTMYQAFSVAYNEDRNVAKVLRKADKLGNKNAMTMKIEYAKGNHSTFAYFPYYSKLSDDSMGTLMLDHDRGFRRSGDVKSYEVTMQQTNDDTTIMVNRSADVLQKGYIPYYVEKDGASGGGNDDIIVYYTKNGSYKTGKMSVASSADSYYTDDGNFLEVSDKNLGKYIQYIMAEDLQLPQKGLDKTKKLARELVDHMTVTLLNDHGAITYTATTEQVIGELRDYLGSNTQYSKQLKMKEVGTDYVENFLFTQKKGYCEHYATAGAVLFRAMGVPARYVSGYRVPASDFLDNGDGTYTAKVADLEAHAWTEVYNLSSGWTVADMTPSSAGGVGEANGFHNPYINTPEPDYGDDTFLENDPESTEKAAPDPSDTPEVTEKPKKTKAPEKSEDFSGGSSERDTSSDAGSEERQTSGKAGISPAVKKMLVKAAVVVVVLFVIWLLWYSQRLRRRRRLKKCHGAGAYLLEANRQLEQMLRCCGYGRPNHMTDQEYIRLLGQIYPKGDRDGMLEQYYHQLERARFDRESGTGEELRECTRLIRSIKKAARSSAKLQRKLLAAIRGW